jgi:hypothetical protein
MPPGPQHRQPQLSRTRASYPPGKATPRAPRGARRLLAPASSEARGGKAPGAGRRVRPFGSAPATEAPACPLPRLWGRRAPRCGTPRSAANRASRPNLRGQRARGMASCRPRAPADPSVSQQNRCIPYGARDAATETALCHVPMIRRFPHRQQGARRSPWALPTRRRPHGARFRLHLGSNTLGGPAAGRAGGRQPPSSLRCQAYSGR